jgi:hypothetical protein
MLPTLAVENPFQKKNNGQMEWKTSAKEREKFKG